MSIVQEVAIALEEWYDWALGGAPEDNPYGFTRGTGLCFNIIYHPRFPNYTYGQESALKLMLALDGLGGDYPFNNNDPDRYERDQFTRSHHLNKQRLEWVKKTIEVYGG